MMMMLPPSLYSVLILTVTVQQPLLLAIFIYEKWFKEKIENDKRLRLTTYTCYLSPS